MDRAEPSNYEDKYPCHSKKDQGIVKKIKMRIFCETYNFCMIKIPIYCSTDVIS